MALPRDFDWVAAIGVAANVATALGFLLGAITAWFGLLTYRGQLRTQADAHVHEVIREMLRVNMDCALRNDPEAETFRLYALEECVDWIRAQQHDLKTWGVLLRKDDRLARGDELEGWEDTIKTHLDESIRDRVAACPQCYSDEFLNFVDEHAPGVTLIAKTRRASARTGKRRGGQTTSLESQ